MSASSPPPDAFSGDRVGPRAFGDGSIETTTSDATVDADGRCEYFAGLSPQRRAELQAAHGRWD